MQAKEKGGTVDACTCVAFLGSRQTCSHDIRAFVFALALVLAHERRKNKRKLLASNENELFDVQNLRFTFVVFSALADKTPKEP